MIAGETVYVERRVAVGADIAREPVYERSFDPVEDVLVVPGETSDITDSARPSGRIVRYTLHFPKGFDRPLAGLKVKVRGDELAVVGDPKPYTPENCPGRWNLAVRVADADG